MAKKVELTNLGFEIEKLVKNHVKDMPDRAMKINSKYAKEFQKELASTSNVGKSRNKKYNKGFVVESAGTKFIVRNKNKPGLTHLLEFGTNRARGYYTYTKAWNKISPKLKNELSVKK
jgi:hypothetical protein